MDAAHNIILHYDQPAVRYRTKEILGHMHRQGADLVRTLLWFRHVNPNSKPSAADVLGVLPARNGVLRATLIRNITEYTRDVQNAGYRVLVLVPGPMLEGSPKCRRVEWGDCFDAATLPASWSVIAQIRRAIGSLETGGFSTLIDLGLEDCAPPTRQPIAQSLPQYVGFMLRNYQRAFGDGRFIVSCGGGKSPAGGLAGLRGLTAMYRQLNAQPAALDLHMYFDQPADYATALEGAEAEAESLNTDFDVLETYVDNIPMFKATKNLQQAGRLRRLRAVALWPLRRGAACSFSETWPEAWSPPFATLGPDPK